MGAPVLHNGASWQRCDQQFPYLTLPELEYNKAGRPDLVLQLKKENERLRAELRELKQNLDKCQ